MIRIRHGSCPDVACHSADKTPPNCRATTDHSCKGYEEERSKGDTGHSCRTLRRVSVQRFVGDAGLVEVKNLLSRTSRPGFCGRVCLGLQRPAGSPKNLRSPRMRRDRQLPRLSISCTDASSIASFAIRVYSFETRVREVSTNGSRGSLVGRGTRTTPSLSIISLNPVSSAVGSVFSLLKIMLMIATRSVAKCCCWCRWILWHLHFVS